MTDLEFQGGGGLTPMILNSTLRSACSADEWRKLRKLDREPGPQSSHSISLDRNSIPPDPGWGYKTEDCNTCDPGQTAEAPTSSDGKRKQRSSDENSESQRCSSGTKTEEENEGHPKGGPADHKRNRAAVRKYRQKKKDQRESLEVEVDLLRKETERLRAQIDAQDASAALCHIWKAEAERLQKILSAMMQLVGVDGGKINNIIAQSAAPGPVQGISSQATDVPMFPQFAKALDGNNKDVRFDQACHPQLDPQLQALQQHSQLQALQQHHHQGNAPALPHQMPSMFAHALHPAQLNGSF
mmetsp:Transcript_41931/g.80210  ORF Transcript_41931/g.80210 Transcript_41931/m.80210 type:complete len:299 (+) Transcript_41931:256-1152(+)